MASPLKVVVVPGWNGSGPGHWQSLWLKANPDWVRVEQRDWINVHVDEWVTQLDDTVRAAPPPVILVAHSLGCLTVAHWAQAFPDTARRVRAALLVAPPDAAAPHWPLRNFAPPPLAPLPFEALVVGSENDPYMTLAAARALAASWGSRFVNAGAVGHINCDSGHGPWSRGLQLLRDLLRRQYYT